MLIGALGANRAQRGSNSKDKLVGYGKQSHLVDGAEHDSFGRWVQFFRLSQCKLDLPPFRGGVFPAKTDDHPVAAFGQ
ncbi:MAG: hypothetical protein COC12_09375 [Rhodobacteraceae bacterium]|nr:MAG: hypothetical protein COC12_09375 [Paracoccaceae bacterium]